MLKRDIKNSSGKICGELIITEKEYIINSNSKPQLILDREEIDKLPRSKKIEKLYDFYFLAIGEIAAICNVCYSNINKDMAFLNITTTKSQGRRNSSYGKKFSEERKRNMVLGRKDDHKQKLGRPVPEEVKKKISETLKRKYASGELVQDPTPHRNNWKNGRYDNVDFGHGIGGHFYSYKNNQEIIFRSLLELKFLIILEENEQVINYEYETVHITCENGSIYIPDFKIGNTLIELKSKKYVHSQESIYNKFLYKVQQAEEYCYKNNLNYKVIYDIDLGFDSRQMKKELLNHPELIEKYKITFFDKSRVGL